MRRDPIAGERGGSQPRAQRAASRRRAKGVRVHPAEGEAGAAAALALAMLLAVAALIAVGLRARTNDLSFEQRSLTRACARWAAESAIARGRAELARDLIPATNGPLSGGMKGAKVRYTIAAERSGGSITLVGDGFCAPEGDRQSALRIRARYAVRDKRLLAWDEGPVPAE